MSKSILAQVQTLATTQEPQSPLEYARSYFASKDIRANALRKIDLKSRRQKQSDIETRFFYEYRELVAQLKALKQAKEDERAKQKGEAPKKIEYAGFSEIQMKRAYDLYLEEASNIEFKDITAGLAFDPSLGHEPIDQLMHLWCEAPTVLDTACVKHFIWQVKRKLASLDIVWELWVNFFGPQGKGKTFLLRMMLAPLQELKDELNIKDIATDDRFMFVLQQAYVIMFEELQFADRASMEAIKATMSKKELSWRRLGHNAQDTGYNNSTFVSSSNKNLAEVFYDPTGMRRFYEVNVRTAFDHEAINKFDYAKIWQCIDETKDSPLMPYLQELLAHQKEHLTQKDTIELYLDDGGYQPTDDLSVRHEIQANSFYKQYVNYCVENGYKSPMSRNTFGLRVKAKGYKSKKKETGTFYYAIKNSTTPLRTYKTTTDN